MKSTQEKKMRRDRRHKRVRAKVIGSDERPRLSVFKSNLYIYAQIINDDSQVTLVSASDIKNKVGTKLERAQKVGELIAQLAKKKNITKVVFDRGGFVYTGRIKALADSARNAGLEF